MLDTGTNKCGNSYDPVDKISVVQEPLDVGAGPEDWLVVGAAVSVVVGAAVSVVVGAAVSVVVKSTVLDSVMVDSDAIVDDGATVVAGTLVGVSIGVEEAGAVPVDVGYGATEMLVAEPVGVGIGTSVRELDAEVAVKEIAVAELVGLLVLEVELEEELDTAGQEMSNRGVSVRGFPTMPKDGDVKGCGFGMVSDKV